MRNNFNISSHNTCQWYKAKTLNFNYNNRGALFIRNWFKMLPHDLPKAWEISDAVVLQSVVQHPLGFFLYICNLGKDIVMEDDACPKFPVENKNVFYLS